MATTTARRRLTEVERAARVEALTAELAAAAVAAVTDSVGWRSMLEVSARFTGSRSGATARTGCGRRSSP
jgi:hypothetical protein